jgi:hypothetical protein
VFAAFTLAGCGGDKSADKTSGGGGSGGSKVTESGGSKGTGSGEKKAIETKQTATLKGKVTFAGATIPERKDLTEQMKAQADKDHCLKGDTKSDEWIVGADKGVAGVVVFLKAPDGSYFDVPEKLRHRTDTVIMDQPFCAFTPHIVAINPSSWDPKAKKQVKTGQIFKVQNSAPMNHNTSCGSKAIFNPGKNTIVPGKKGDKIEALVYDAKPCRDTETGNTDVLSVNCDIHKWMNAKVAVFDHPYYAVTKEDGTFEIKDAPADVPLEVVVWHESMGDNLKKGTKTDITLKPGENNKNFEVGK